MGALPARAPSKMHKTIAKKFCTLCILTIAKFLRMWYIIIVPRGNREREGAKGS